MNLKKAILKIFSVNFLQLISSLIIGFVVPSILSIEGYANLKTYTLYVSYIGFFHLGFVDGLYIKYGGKKYTDIDKSILKGEHNFLVLFQSFVSLLLLLFSIIFKNVVLLLFSISILPIMVQAFFKYIYQATGEFKKYTNIIKKYTVVYVALNVLLAVIFRNSNYVLYCLTSFFANAMSVLSIEYKFIKENKQVLAKYDVDKIKNVIKTGFIILLGNLSVMAILGIDKWFVKFLYTTEDFAYYSFAVSMLNLINTLLSAISITLYNYLFENNNVNKINDLKLHLITIGAFASSGYFVLSFIIKCFIPKYIPAISVIAITFSTLPYMILINALYVNLYKINKDEKKYLRVVIIMLIISIIYNIIFHLLFKNVLAIAWATLFTLTTWTIYSTINLEKIIIEKRMILFLIAITTSFVLSSRLFEDYMIQFLIYCVSLIVFVLFFNRKFLKEIFNFIKSDILKNIKMEGKK